MAFQGALTHVALLPPVTARTTTATGTATDFAGYANGAAEVLFTVNCGTITGTQGTLDVTIEQCDTTNGTFSTIATFAQLTTTTGASVKHAAVTKRYVRAVGTTGGTSPSAVYSVSATVQARVV